MIDADDEIVVVPVKPDVFSNEVIGELRIRKSQIPLSPYFVFGTAYRLDDGKHSLIWVAPVLDEQYETYLKEKFRGKDEPFELRFLDLEQQLLEQQVCYLCNGREGHSANCPAGILEDLIGQQLQSGPASG